MPLPAVAYIPSHPLQGGDKNHASNFNFPFRGLGG